MPMPTDGAWPPKAYQPAYSRYQDWDAWYRGDPDQLRFVYAGRGDINQPAGGRQRILAWQYSGGVLGRFSRWMWGAPPSATERDSRIHVPLPADLASTAANLLFSEPPKLVLPDDIKDTATQKRLTTLEEDGLANLLLHAAEANSFLGDVYLRPVIDEDVQPGKAFLTTVHADGALPVIRWGHLIEVTFWHCLYADGHQHVRLLEHHSVVDGKGQIEYAIYQGSVNELGTKISLEALREYGMPELLDDDLVENQGVQPTGLDRLDVIRIPNAGPQRTWRSMPLLKYYGRSDFDGNEQVFDQIDDTWTSWLRDLRLARARLLVPEYMMKDAGAGKGAVFDNDQEFWVALQTMPKQNSADTGITSSQFAIRHVEHKATIDALVEVALRHAGLSSQTLGEQGGDMAMTATEAQARERQSFVTRGNRIQTWTPGIADAVELLMMVEALNFNGPAPVRPNVEFGDSVSESPETTARTANLLRTAQAASDETLVRLVHPDWDKTQVDEEVKKIADQRAAENPPVADPTQMFGNDNGPPHGPAPKPGDTTGGKPPSK